ncbi:hypothetical protein GCM10010278_74530 [Streptomyces melanogenes]|nr:hypothetical protein GCM10010278_74530 [Streptomyces melanogenes]
MVEERQQALMTSRSTPCSTGTPEARERAQRRALLRAARPSKQNGGTSNVEVVMPGFLDRAKEQAQSALNQGKQKVDEVQQQRAGNDLLKQLGAAYYAERRGSGTPDATQKALSALEAHIAAHGDGFLRG